jgi:hypothetical protein
MAAPEVKLSPSRTQGRQRSIKHSVVSIQPLTRLPLISAPLGQSMANHGGVL